MCNSYALNLVRLFTSRGYPSQADFFSDPTCWTRIIVYKLEREVDIAKERKTLNGAIHAEIINISVKAGNDSLEEAAANVSDVGKCLGWRFSENLRLVKKRLNIISVLMEGK